MKFTLNWLKEHLETDASLETIVEGLMGIGLEVEDVHDPAKLLAPFTVAKVREARQHPDADRLRVCDVETAEGLVQVVCGAPNARTGMTGIFAAPGSHIPGIGVDLEVGVIRGVKSAGMLLSERELMISDNHEGIIDLADHFAVGTPAAVALGLDDPVIHVGVTPNRPDALGVYGIARDLAAKGLGRLVPLKAEKVAGGYDSPVPVRIDDTDACPLFIGRHFRKLRNGPSPDWMQTRLRAIGLRPISALVDITNYVMFAFARPLHVFDAAKLTGGITVRLSRPGETIEALDGRTYDLDDSVTVIADDAGPQGLGGVMGGEDTGCTGDTTEVLLEAALFDPLRTAATGRKLQIISDARYRFERGVDPAFVETGVELATRLILDICGGEASNLVIAGQEPEWRRNYALRKSRVESLGGVKVPGEEQTRILTDLGFTVSETADAFDCAVPSWRPDVRGEADLVEEVCRIHGLDKVPPAPLPRSHAVARPVLSQLQRRMIATRRRLAERGLNEAVTWSFLPQGHAELFGGGVRDLQLVNPISSELSDMRPSLIPNLIAATGRNVARGLSDVALFELGQAYAGSRPEDETLRAAGVRRGNFEPRHWATPQRAIDVFDAKADMLAALEAAGAPVSNVQVVKGGPAWFHPGRSGTLQLGPKTILGWFGEIHPRVLDRMDVKGPLVAFEIVLGTVPEARTKSATRPALVASDLMPVKRDFAFLMDTNVEAASVVKAAKGADKALIEDVSVFDVFTGGALGEGKKSLAIEVTLQPRDRTLTEAEIEYVSSKIIAQVTRATGATLRG
ncbi:MAG TPA: phenylalanine--tRNA ligase subunit beta [Aestuariivirgaceae bacterium]|nr:phenylalanine--tRNA ligase subunit beta [Aestuariivirgaceae bacterium]